MPIYDYQCTKCEHLMEVYQRIGDKPPVCCGEAMSKKIGFPALTKMGAPLWTSRVDDIHKAQEQRGERLRHVDPREVR